jgi:H+/Cl- antiporter ClcA
MNVTLHVNLIRLVIPEEPPHSFPQAMMTVMFIGALSGSITSIAGAAIDRAKAWKGHPVVRLVVGSLGLGASAVILVLIAAPQTAVGPGGGAILWAETAPRNAMTVLAVALLRAVATTAGAAAGGCGGLFVPFLAVGDLGGRVFAHGFGVPDDLAGSAGAASGIAGGYRLPWTAVAMLLGLGEAHVLAMVCCLATVVVAAVAGKVTRSLVDRLFDVLGTASAPKGTPVFRGRRRLRHG